MTCETNGLEFAYKYLSIIGPQFGFLDHQDVEFMAEPRDIWARILRHRCGWKKGMLSINGRWTGIAILKPTLTSFNELYPPSTFSSSAAKANANPSLKRIECHRSEPNCRAIGWQSCKSRSKDSARTPRKTGTGCRVLGHPTQWVTSDPNQGPHPLPSA